MNRIPNLIISWSLITALATWSCATHKDILSIGDLSGDQVVIIGLIEFDYSHLENKIIQGIDVYIESGEKCRDIRLNRNYLPNETYKDFNFIGKIGHYGVYELHVKKSVNYTPDTDNLLTVMDMERNISSTQTNTLFQFKLYEGKVINIGKFIIQYKGGTIDSGKINYSYELKTVGNDTTALYAFSQAYPEIYETYKNEIYFFTRE
jgi:hypothetical protein